MKKGMTMDEAIKTLKSDLIFRHPYTREEVNTAIGLGIEALLAVKSHCIFDPEFAKLVKLRKLW